MSVGILLVSHMGVATTMLKTAARIWQTKSVNIDSIEVEFDADVNKTVLKAEVKLQQLDQGDGVLILTDLVGATPCNLVSSIVHPNTIVITGLNLPMLIRAYNYADSSIDKLAELAVEGGQRGIARLNESVCNITGN